VQITFVLRLQASAANVERARSLTWAEAMKSGEAPLPQQTDEDASYDSSSSSDSPDVHQLAHDARKKRAEVSAKQRMWNDAVEVSWPTWPAQVVSAVHAALARMGCRTPHSQHVCNGWTNELCGCVLAWTRALLVEWVRQLLTLLLLLLLLLLQSNAEQARLRELRGELNAARAELTEAQQQLVAARGEEAKMRKVLEEEPQKDRTLGARGACWWWYCPAMWLGACLAVHAPCTFTSIAVRACVCTWRSTKDKGRMVAVSNMPPAYTPWILPVGRPTLAVQLRLLSVVPGGPSHCSSACLPTDYCWFCI
jgi:hypothetical protein